MNTYTIYLSSNSTSYTQQLSTELFEDESQLTLNLERLFNDVIPIYVKINWGDGNEEVQHNNIYSEQYSNVLLFNTYNPVFIDPYPHVYYPSETSTYKLLSAQISVSYSDGNYSYFVVPVQIRTYGMAESLGEIHLTNTNISENLLELQLNNEESLIEMIIPRH